jgi:aminoglycoside phosphotransferase (APT) family kinase protein
MEPMDQFVGTQPLRQSHAFDVGALEQHLRRELPGFAGPLAVEQFKGGQSNPTYKLITPHATYAMRTKPGPAAKLLPSAHAIEREFRVMRALADTEVPVARMHLLCDDESVIGRAFYVMEFVEGRVLWEQALPGFTREGRAAIYDEMNRVSAAPGRRRGARAGRLRQAGQLLRAPDRALEQAVPSLADAADSRDGPPDRLAAHSPAAVGVGRIADDHRAR